MIQRATKVKVLANRLPLQFEDHKGYSKGIKANFEIWDYIYIDLFPIRTRLLDISKRSMFIVNPRFSRQGNN